MNQPRANVGGGRGRHSKDLGHSGARLTILLLVKLSHYAAEGVVLASVVTLVEYKQVDLCVKIAKILLVLQGSALKKQNSTPLKGKDVLTLRILTNPWRRRSSRICAVKTTTSAFPKMSSQSCESNLSVCIVPQSSTTLASQLERMTLAC